MLASKLRALAFAAAAFAFASPAIASDIPKGPLVTTEWLEKNLSNPNVRVVEVSVNPGVYEKGHIPGAVNLGWKNLKDPDNELYVIPPEKLAELMGQQGVGNETTVVAYDDQGGLGPARLWWVLEYYGHRTTKILNGGWNKWVKEKRPVTTEVSTPSPTQSRVNGQRWHARSRSRRWTRSPTTSVSHTCRRSWPRWAR